MIGGNGLLFSFDSLWTAVTALTYRQDIKMCSQMNRAPDSIHHS